MNINYRDVAQIFVQVSKASVEQLQTLSDKERIIVCLALKNIQSGDLSKIPTDKALDIKAILEKLVKAPRNVSSLGKGVDNLFKGVILGSEKTVGQVSTTDLKVEIAKTDKALKGVDQVRKEVSELRKQFDALKAASGNVTSLGTTLAIKEKELQKLETFIRIQGEMAKEQEIPASPPSPPPPPPPPLEDDAAAVSKHKRGKAFVELPEQAVSKHKRALPLAEADSFSLTNNKGLAQGAEDIRSKFNKDTSSEYSKKLGNADAAIKDFIVKYKAEIKSHYEKLRGSDDKGDVSHLDVQENLKMQEFDQIVKGLRTEFYDQKKLVEELKGVTLPTSDVDFSSAVIDKMKKNACLKILAKAQPFAAASPENLEHSNSIKAALQKSYFFFETQF